MSGQPLGANSWGLAEVRTAFVAAGCQRLYAKILATNDDSKKQIYLGGDLSALSLFPFARPVPSTKKDSAAQFAALKFRWLVENSVETVAPTAKLIVYPDYPEVRLSGFLKGCERAPTEALREYAARDFPDRVLFMGVRGDSEIVAMLVWRAAAIVSQLQALPDSERRGVFNVINLRGAVDTKTELCRRLCEIHGKGWLPPKRLGAGGLVDCKGTNCGGYTLEAALGVAANGVSEPDLLGWEIKQHGVTNFVRPPSGVVTLFTPEPNGGVYADEGVSAFIERFGYADKIGREDRRNFGGTHRCGEFNASTGLTLVCTGFDRVKGVVSDLAGGVELVDRTGVVAARWAFVELLEHWRRKHAAAAFVPSMVRRTPSIAYCYGREIHLGVETDFNLLLRAFCAGTVYYDPGIKMEAASSSAPVIKRRSQFRTKFANLASLYKTFSHVDACEVARSAG